MIVYVHGPKFNNKTGMALHACFYFRGKKGNSSKKKNEHGDICILINNKFKCKIPFKEISFFVPVVTLCDIFYSRFRRFFGLNVFFIN